jgi:galactose oxidase
MAATAVMCVLVGSAIALHEQSPDATAAAADPHAGHVMPKAVPVAVTQAAPLPATGWTITADSNSAQAANVLDGDATTLWRTAATALPHLLTIDTQNRIALSGLTYLPPADSANGRIGRYEVLISDDGTTWSKPVATGTFADDATLKTVAIATVVTRFVRLRALSEAGNRTTKSAAAEINLLGGTDPALPRTGWTATADSQETAGEDGRGVNALDGNNATYWHTQWQAASPPHPHEIQLDLGRAGSVSCVYYRPRQNSPRGRIATFEVHTSTDGTNWGTAAATGTWLDTVN